ncbi:methyltransferase domain-containing protein [Hymenobacter sp. YC55]|uniref:class I SAM-dependent methyltransferase n=1 Tax=Hymenobacter sp. YC55 TaxID=3034019 RepID=UPI0023F750ED|nr:methyltransferase domain-containing protein [Hymenobacter sp. YC55]MDF7815914.1 methyltransferase domain-containing protein [Hymenobacter sp. YC55]
MRKPGQGVWNIIRFNWHFYGVATGVGLLLGVLAAYSPAAFRLYTYALLFLVASPTLVSLLVSYYVYDTSNLYSLGWLNVGDSNDQKTVVNIHAGFDETSELLRQHFAEAELVVLDFYDPTQHTEVSIKRARAAYPPYPGTKGVQTHALPLPDASADLVFVLLAAHEIRQPAQRVSFFKELRRSLRPQGRIIVVEHLRDPANFFAYTIGFLHFYSWSTWQGVFRAAGLGVEEEKKITPFLSVFILR